MIRTLAILMVVVALSPAGAADVQDNVAVARAMVGAINGRELDGLDAYVAGNIVRHCAATPDIAVSNIEEFRAFLQADFAAVPDSVMEIELIFGGGDYVAMRARYSGTQSGSMGPFPPSGKRFEIPFLAIFRLSGGKIAEIWVEWDNLNALSQLGHIGSHEP